MKTHQIHKSVDNFRFNLRVEENQPLFFAAFHSTEEGKKIKDYMRTIFIIQFMSAFFFLLLCSDLYQSETDSGGKKPDKTFSDLSNDYLNKFVLAHVHVDFAPLKFSVTFDKAFKWFPGQKRLQTRLRASNQLQVIGCV